MFKRLKTNVDNIPNEPDKLKEINNLSKFGHSITLSKKIIF